MAIVLFLFTFSLIYSTWQISCKKQQLRNIHDHLASPLVFGWIHVDHIFCFLCCVICSVCLCSMTFAQCWLCLWIDLQFSLTFTDLEYLNDQRYIFYVLPNTGAYIIRISTLSNHVNLCVCPLSHFLVFII